MFLARSVSRGEEGFYVQTGPPGFSDAPVRVHDRADHGSGMRRTALVLVLPLAAGIAAAADVKVTIREWDVPTPDSRPHDPEAAPDGALWYTGQLANKLGRLDPKSGAIREFPVKTPDSGPHGLAADNAGNIWFTANSKGYIGKLDPKTGGITEY